MRVSSRQNKPSVPGISAVQFQRHLGLAHYETAFQMLHRLRAGMVRPDQDRIGAEWLVEVDETLVGGRTQGCATVWHSNKVKAASTTASRTKSTPACEVERLGYGRAAWRSQPAVIQIGISGQKTRNGPIVRGPCPGLP